ncbi:MAG: bacteriocin [Clostridium beijerinckii]|jgi:bacteriocin-like protein|nr:bacteriocin [Clostridium beijerinckii]
MNNFVEMTNNELDNINGGAFEIYVFGKVLTGAAAFGVVGVAAVGLVGVGALAWYVASKN